MDTARALTAEDAEARQIRSAVSRRGTDVALSPDVHLRNVVCLWKDLVLFASRSDLMCFQHVGLSANARLCHGRDSGRRSVASR